MRAQQAAGRKEEARAAPEQASAMRDNDRVAPEAAPPDRFVGAPGIDGWIDLARMMIDLLDVGKNVHAPSSGPHPTEQSDASAASSNAPQASSAEQGGPGSAAIPARPAPAVEPPPQATPSPPGPSAAGSPAVRTLSVDPSATSAAAVTGWRVGVRGRAQSMPKAAVLGNGAAMATLQRVGAAASKRADAIRKEGPADAVACAPAAPEVEPSPAPPAGDPVPMHTRRVIDASHKTLSVMTAPALLPSNPHKVDGVIVVGGQLPILGTPLIPDDMLATLTAPGAALPHGTPLTQQDAELQQALQILAGPAPKDLAVAAAVSAVPVVFASSKSPPPRPFPPEQSAPVSEVVARLMADLDSSTSDVMVRMRKLAYPGGVLAEQFPDIGQALAGGLRSQLEQQLGGIAAEAGVGADELARMVQRRRDDLRRSTELVCKAGDEAALLSSQEAAKGGGLALATVESVSRAVDVRIGQQADALSGGRSPDAINQRRDGVVGWMRGFVERWTSEYQHAGEARSRDLRKAEEQQAAAYRSQSQREEFQVQSPGPPRAPRHMLDVQRETQLATVVETIRKERDERIDHAQEAFQTLQAQTQKETKTHRSVIEAAGTQGIEAARAWAEDETLAGRSWFAKVWARVQRWTRQSRDVNEAWRVRRTAETRDAIDADLRLIAAAQQLIDEGATAEKVLQDERFGQAHRAALQEFFAMGPDANPLDFAARRLRQEMAELEVEHARPRFEQELIATQVARKDFPKMDRLAKVGHSVDPAFEPGRIASQVYHAIHRVGTEEDDIYSALANLTPLLGAIVRKQYYAEFGEDMEEDIKDDMSGDERDRALSQLRGDAVAADIFTLHDAIDSLNTRESDIMAVLRGKTPEQIEAIKAAYKREFHVELKTHLKDNLDGNDLAQANAHMASDPNLADAIQLDDAMNNAHWYGGASVEQLEAVYERVRKECLDRAKAERWSSERMDRELQKRLATLERRYEEKYGATAGGGAHRSRSALETNMRGAFSKSELDLGLALKTGDTRAADAARIQIEHESTVYASDARINSVLASQYERAREKVALDLGPRLRSEMHEEIKAEVEKMRRGPPVRPVDDEEISRIRMRKEREIEARIDAAAENKSKESMEGLKGAYARTYGLDLGTVVIADTQFGGEDRAGRLLKQGGRLYAIDEVELATLGLGTDIDTLRRILPTLTKAQIDDLDAKWFERHGEHLKDMLEGETMGGGRDRVDLVDMLDGAPESAKERIRQQRKKVRREKEMKGVLASLAEDEEAWMDYSLAELDKLEAKFDRTDLGMSGSDARERERLMGDLDFQTQRVEDAVESHRKGVDTAADMAAEIAGYVVMAGAAVATIAVEVFSLGTATPAMIGMWAAIIGGVSTIGLNAAIKGGAYGYDEAALQVGVTALDAASGSVGGKVAAGIRTAKPAAAVAAKTGTRAALARGAKRYGREAAAMVADAAIGGVPSSALQAAADPNFLNGDPLSKLLEAGGKATLMGVGQDVGMRALGGIAKRGLTSKAQRSRMEASERLNEGLAAHQETRKGASMEDFLLHDDSKPLLDDMARDGLLPKTDQANRFQGKASRQAQLEAALPQGGGEPVRVVIDDTLKGRTVEVRRETGANGQVISVTVHAGRGARPSDIALHVDAVDTARRYVGASGDIKRRLRNVADRLLGGRFAVGSERWNAVQEARKLSSVMASRALELRRPNLSRAERAKLRTELRSVHEQLRHFEASLRDRRWGGGEGRDYVAAEGIADGEHAHAGGDELKDFNDPGGQLEEGWQEKVEPDVEIYHNERGLEIPSEPGKNRNEQKERREFAAEFRRTVKEAEKLAQLMRLPLGRRPQASAVDEPAVPASGSGGSRKYAEMRKRFEAAVKRLKAWDQWRADMTDRLNEHWERARGRSEASLEREATAQGWREEHDRLMAKAAEQAKAGKIKDAAKTEEQARLKMQEGKPHGDTAYETVRPLALEEIHADLPLVREFLDAGLTVHAQPYLKGTSKELGPAALARLLGKSPRELFPDAWEKAVARSDEASRLMDDARRFAAEGRDAAAKRATRKAEKAAEDLLWTEILRDPAAMAKLDAAGVELTSFGAPYLFHPDGTIFVLTFEHVNRRMDRPDLAIAGDNIVLSFSYENSDYLEKIRRIFRDRMKELKMRDPRSW
jgi:hypothetical protein